MSIFNEMLKSGESIFLNEFALDYNFIPKLVPYREREQRAVASCIKPLFQSRNGRNLLIFGPPGVGKTVACKHLLQELEDETDEILPVYVNCWQKNTSYKIVLEICDQLGYKFVQNKKTDELFDVVVDIVNKKAAVFVFDEIDKAEDFDFLYTLLENVFKKTVVLITNNRAWLKELDDRIRSRLTAETLEFREYNDEEIKGILKQRMGYGFVPGAFADEAFQYVAKKTFELKDVRQGLFMMREAGLSAEDRSSKKVTIGDVENAISKLDLFSIKKSDDLDIESQKVLEIVRKSPGSKIGDAFRAYQTFGGSGGYKTFQRKVAKLEKSNFIKTSKISGGAEGKTTILRPAVEKKLSDYESS